MEHCEVTAANKNKTYSREGFCAGLCASRRGVLGVTSRGVGGLLPLTGQKIDCGRIGAGTDAVERGHL